MMSIRDGGMKDPSLAIATATGALPFRRKFVWGNAKKKKKSFEMYIG